MGLGTDLAGTGENTSGTSIQEHDLAVSEGEENETETGQEGQTGEDAGVHECASQPYKRHSKTSQSA